MFKKRICFLLLAAWVAFAQDLFAQCSVQIDPPAVVSCQNPTVQLNATISPPGGNYSIQWGGPVSDPFILNPTGNGPGIYVVYITDSLSGCWAGDTVVVEHDGSFPEVSIEVQNNNCAGPTTVTANVTGTGSYEYSWVTGETTQTIEPPQTPGGVTTLCVTVTDATSGCTNAACVVVTQFGPLEADIFYFASPFCDDSSGMWVAVQGGAPPYAFLWSNGYTGAFFPTPPVGTYIVTITDANGCTLEASYVVEDNPNDCAHLEGFVLADWNTNCTVESSDDGLTQIVIKITDASGNEYFTNSNSSGFYSISLNPGDYDITVLPPNNLWNPCQATYSISLAANQMYSQDFLLQPEAICPAMSVDLGTPFLRRCFNGQYSISYCNQGTEDALNAYIEVLFDPFLTVSKAQIPYTDLGNNLYRFDLGAVPFNTCGSFWVQVQVSCAATLGQTHCTEATIYPTGTCEPVNPQWSGASLQLDVDCNPDSVEFLIKNIGTGVMSAPLEYVIIEDAVMLMQAPPPTVLLLPSEEYTIKVPANGSTWRVEVDQEQFHPGNAQMLAAWAEGCTAAGQFSMGFVNQFPAGDNDPWVDIDCTENVGSYDPNDKQGAPIGYDAAHYIEPGTDIEYMIRFQNTGTDTAFTVVIRDQLAPWLDPGSVRPGASSHPYTFEYYGDRDIKFTFDNILLPDSSVNQEASQGFVSFKISQKAGVPLQTDILNTAGIFFDFNAPVNTNTTVHRIGREFVTVSSWQPAFQGLDLRIMPNPVAQEALLELRSFPGLTNWEVELRDATGRPVRNAMVTGTQWRFERGSLPAGVYFIQVHSEGKPLGVGKVVLR